MEKKTNAPFIITSKDLDYLKDMFNWNNTFYKFNKTSLSNIKDKDIKKMFNDMNDIFKENMQNIITLLTEGEKNA